jgi:hypothetical protein
MDVPSLVNPAVKVSTKDLASQIVHCVLCVAVGGPGVNYDWRAHVQSLPNRERKEVEQHLKRLAVKIARHFRLKPDKGE